MRGGYICAAPVYGFTGLHQPGLWVYILFPLIFLIYDNYREIFVCDSLMSECVSRQNIMVAKR